jgi:hypothetical protein
MPDVDRTEIKTKYLLLEQLFVLRWIRLTGVRWIISQFQGVIVEVTKHDNYRIACKGGVLKECLGAQRFQVESLKDTAHYDLDVAFRSWSTMKKISIREALSHISKMGGARVLLL